MLIVTPHPHLGQQYHSHRDACDASRVENDQLHLALQLHLRRPPWWQGLLSRPPQRGTAEASGPYFITTARAAAVVDLPMLLALDAQTRISCRSISSTCGTGGPNVGRRHPWMMLSTPCAERRRYDASIEVRRFG